VEALNAPRSYYEELRRDYRARRDLMLSELRASGFEPYVPEGSYFALADHRAFGFASDVAFAMHLVEKLGVACIPCSAFYAPGEDGTKDAGAHSLVRFAFCKTDATILAAGERLRGLRATRA
jgi:aspartate/methionine/tyrosine aminotransferase